MNRSCFFFPCILLVLLVSGCASATPTEVVVILTPVVEEVTQRPIETAQRELEIVTPTIRDLQPPVDSPTQLPPLIPEDMTVDSWFSISPDGVWTAQVQVAYPLDNSGETTGDQYYVRLEILNKAGKPAWTVLDEWSNWGLGYTIPAILSWSSDSLRLYFTEQAIADGCAVFGHQNGLFEVNLEDGSVRDISEGAYGELQISPSGERIAILSKEILTVKEISTGDATQSSLEFEESDWQAGKLLWEPDEKSILFTVMFNPCVPPDSSSVYSSIYAMNVKSGELTVLIEKDTRAFIARQWLENRRIELVDKAGAKWNLNPATNDLQKIE